MTRSQARNPRDARARFVAELARELGTTPADVAEHLREAIAAGFLIETPDGWQATLPTGAETDTPR